MIRTIVLGSRGSRLALWQAEFVKAKLEGLGYATELKIISTKGDRIQNVSFNKIEGKGFFTKEIEEALLNNEIDLAVHSYKDMPTTSPDGLVLAGNSYRENAADWMFVSKSVYQKDKKWGLPEGASIGTSSPRRAAQLLANRPDLKIVPIRGNVPTRLAKTGNEVDAVVLAAAGVSRLDLDFSDYHLVELDKMDFVPAPAQGVLAYQCRTEDDKTLKAIAQLNKPYVSEEITIERTILNKLEGGCQQPIGIYTKRQKNVFSTWVFFQKAFDVDAPKVDIYQRFYHQSTNGDETVKQIVNAIKNPKKQRIFISRELGNDSYFKQYHLALGNTITGQSLIDFKPVNFNWDNNADWLFFSSKKGVEYFFNGIEKLNSNIKIAAIGEGTANAIKALGYTLNFKGNGANLPQTAKNFLEQAQGQKVIFLQPTNSRKSVQKALGNAINSVDLICYDNPIKTEFKLPEIDVLVFTSPLNAKAYYAKYPISTKQTVVSIGVTTSAELNKLGLKNIRTAYFPCEKAMADCCW